MAISVAALSGRLPRIQVVIPGADLLAGASWHLVGTAGAWAWTPRGGSGVGTGDQVVLVDALCPLNVAATYSLWVNGVVTSTAVVRRQWVGADVITSLDGMEVVEFIRTGDRRQGVRRFWQTDVPGSSTSPLRLAPRAGAGGGQFTAETDAVATRAFEDLLDTNAPLLVLHNLADDSTSSTVKPVQMIYVTSDESDVLAGEVTSFRVWPLTYVVAPDPEPGYRQPLSTWDEFDAAWLGKTWDEFDAAWLGNTWDQFDRTDWTQVGM